MHIWFGNVTLEIRGYKPEKFINIAAKRKLYFKNVKYIEKNILVGDIDFASFKKLRPVALKSKCRMRIKKKRGSLLLLKRCWNRKVFFIEGLCSIAILLFLSSLLGYIQINAPTGVSRQEILSFIYESGIREGMFKHSIDDELLAKNLVLEFDHISWAEVRVSGMRLMVDVAQTVPRPEIVPYIKPCDLVAHRDGVIYSMNIKNGMRLVEIGDTVSKGDVLVTGHMRGTFDENEILTVHAHGVILAKTWYEERQVVNTSQINRKRTGNYARRTWIEILGLRIRIPGRRNRFSNFESVTQKDNVLLWGWIRLPISRASEKHYEYTEEIIDIDGDTAMRNARQAAYEKALAQIPDGAEIINVRFSYENVQNDGISVVVIVECIEDIGVKVEIQPLPEEPEATGEPEATQTP